MDVDLSTNSRRHLSGCGAGGGGEYVADSGKSLRPALGAWIKTNILVLGEDATLQFAHGSGTAFNGDLDEAAVWDRVWRPRRWGPRLISKATADGR